MNVSSRLLPIPPHGAAPRHWGHAGSSLARRDKRPVPWAESPPFRNRKDTAKPVHVKARDLSPIVLPERYFVETRGLRPGGFCGQTEAFPDAFLTHLGGTFRTWTDDGDCGYRRGFQSCWPSWWSWPRSSPDPAGRRPDHRRLALPQVAIPPLHRPPPGSPRRRPPHRRLHRRRSPGFPQPL